MKHIYLLIIVLFGGFLHAQIINFPDANFKAKLLQANTTNGIAYDTNSNSIVIDANSDGEIQLSEAQNVHSLEIMNSAITDLTGIASFVNLKWLNCTNNSLTTLDLGNSIALMSLHASHNSLSTVSVNFVSAVEGIDLSYNNLTSFAFSGSEVYDTFNLSHNQITNLQLEDCMLEYINVSYNQLSQIQFNGDVRLFRWTNFTHNQFTLMDLSGAKFDYDAHVQLGYNVEDKVLFSETHKPGNIDYSSDAITFDLGNFHATTSCDPEDTGNVSIFNCPNLQNVIFKNGLEHGYFTCNEGGTIFQKESLSLGIANCPNLNHICVDGGDELTVVQNRINQLGLQSQVVVDSNCTSSVLGATTFVSDEPFSVSPVPAQNVLQISVKNTMTIDDVKVLNTIGQLLISETGATQSVDVSNLSSGSYFINVKTNEGAFVKQFLKE
ncbi:MAG: T9SS type A sorting domain-containing protein [Flavobacterium sp.]|nr:T9SS type A sorting domain-containing protein [Flavobacterium sp.]